MSKRLQKPVVRIGIDAAVIAIATGLIYLAMASGFISPLSAKATQSPDEMAWRVTQLTLESIGGSITQNGTGKLLDGNGHTWVIRAADGGAAVRDGRIDYREDAPPQYHMNFVVCNHSTQSTWSCRGSQTVYDVRWHVESLSGGGHMVTIGARRIDSSQTYVASANLSSFVGQ